MEEGPEPQEWVERATEEHHHKQEHGEGESRAEMMSSAITAAILAVMAAIGSLLSGHAANHAILGQTLATDQWAYYQAVSTRSHLYEVNAELLEAMNGGEKAAEIKPKVEQLQKKAKDYDAKKEEIRKEAEHLVEESRLELKKHNRYSLGIAAFQVGIVLASVSILVKVRTLWSLSLVAGVVGLGYLFSGFVA